MAPSFRSVPFLFLAACAGDPWDSLDARYTEVEVQAGMANRDTSRQIHNKEARKRKIKAESARVALFQDPAVQTLIADARAGGGDVKHDPVRAKAELYWQRSLTARSWRTDEKAEETRLVAALEEVAANEATWFSPDGAVKVGLSQSWDDASREVDTLDDESRAGLAESWVEHQIRPLGSDLVALVELRNTVAQREGFANYWELSLAAQGLTPTGVDAIIAELSEVIRPILATNQQRIAVTAQSLGVADSFANRPLLRRRSGLDAGRDEAEVYTDADGAEEIVRTAFADLGIDSSGWQVFTGPRRYFRAGVNGFVIRPPDHVAIVMSQDERWSFWPYEALAHEAGHAVWWQGVGPDAVKSPVYWQPPDPWFEGFAQFFERMAFERAFLERYLPNLPAAEREGLSAWRARRVAEAIADSIISVQVERKLYSNPKDLVALTREAAASRSALTGEPLGPTASNGLSWESSLLSGLLWSYPAFDQNYLYAYLTEAWMYEAVTAAVGDPVGNPKVGPLLQEKLIRADNLVPFPDRLFAIGQVDRDAALTRYLASGPLPPLEVSPPPPEAAEAAAAGVPKAGASGLGTPTSP